MRLLLLLPFLFISMHLQAQNDWAPLLNGHDLAGWQGQDGKPHEWFTAKSAKWVEGAGGKTLTASPAPGGVMLNAASGQTANLVTARKFGDVQLRLEFLISKGSNSGVYLQGLYEIQIKDSWGVEKPDTHANGAIYQRWIDGKGVGGTAPLVNASGTPGAWQSLDISFRAPRFDAAGKKTENARFLRVTLNGTLIHENVEAEGPTRASMKLSEASENPLMLQGDHGPVAFRNIRVRELRPDRVK